MQPAIHTFQRTTSGPDTGNRDTDTGQRATNANECADTVYCSGSADHKPVKSNATRFVGRIAKHTWLLSQAGLSHKLW